MSAELVQKRALSIRAVLQASCLAVLVVLIDTSMFNLARIEVERQLHASALEAELTVGAFVTATAAFLLPAGLLLNRGSPIRILRAGLLIMLVSSVAAMLVAKPWWLIAWRFVMGMGASLVFPASLVLLERFTERGRDGVLRPFAELEIWNLELRSWWASMTVVGIVFGPLVGASAVWSWRWPFVVAAAMAALAIFAVGRLERLSNTGDLHHEPPKGVPVSQVALAVAAPFLLVGSVSMLLVSAWWWLGVIVGAVLGVTFVVREVRGTQGGVLPAELFIQERDFGVGVVSMAAVWFALLGALFLLPDYLQRVLGLAPAKAGLALAAVAGPLLVAIVLVESLLGDRANRRTVLRRSSQVGVLLVAAALIGSVWLLPEAGEGLFPGYWIVLIVVGCGAGATNLAATYLIQETAPNHLKGSAASTNDSAREVAGALGLAIISTRFGLSFRNAVDEDGSCNPAADSVDSAAECGIQLSQIQADFMDSLENGLLLGAAACGVGLLVMYLIGRS